MIISLDLNDSLVLELQHIAADLKTTPEAEILRAIDIRCAAYRFTVGTFYPAIEEFLESSIGRQLDMPDELVRNDV